jgi:hypothetical protein
MPNGVKAREIEGQLALCFLGRMPDLTSCRAATPASEARTARSPPQPPHRHLLGEQLPAHRQTPRQTQSPRRGRSLHPSDPAGSCSPTPPPASATSVPNSTPPASSPSERFATTSPPYRDGMPRHSRTRPLIPRINHRRKATRLRKHRWAALVVQLTLGVSGQAPRVFRGHLT